MRSKKQRRSSGKPISAQILNTRNATSGSGPDKRDGRARPDTPTRSPVTPVDAQARVIKTRS